MKNVIFVCLLSLSVCLSQASSPIEKASNASNAAPELSKQNDTVVDGKTAVGPTKPEHSQTTTAEVSSNKTSQAAVVAASTQNATVNTNVTQAGSASNETSIKVNDTATEKNNSTQAKPSPDTPATKEVKNETKTIVPEPVKNNTKADNKDDKKNETTTPKGQNVSPTVAPTVEAKSRAFDGPSFIGGIILTLGLLAIGFMGFKYYKNQTERNYHTL